MAIILLFLICATISINNAYVPVNKNMKSFTSALKNAHFEGNQEMTVYENTEGPGVVTELWFTTGDFNENTTLRIYVDDDYTNNKASIECKLYLCHSIGFIGNKQNEGEYVPWSTKRIGHQAFDGGLYNTYQIPFGERIKITLWQPTAATFWFIVRGVLNFPIVLGNLQLPSNSRLRLFKNEDVLLQPYQMLTLANISGTSGAILQVFMQAQAVDFPFIEGCYRVKIDNDTVNGHEYQFLSSGVEDFYLSGFAFDKGVYHGDNSGCTYIAGGIYDHTSTSNITFSAYKFFENDPILFSDSLSLLWKCGSNGDCPTTWPPNNGGNVKRKRENLSADQSTKVTSYCWIYTYTLE